LLIDKISAMEFNHVIPNQFSMGYKEGSSWFKITLNNITDNEHFVLYFTEPFWTSLILYKESLHQEKLSKKKVESSFQNSIDLGEENALNVLLKDRKIKDVNPAFFLNIKKGETKVLYIEGRSVSAHIGEFQVFTEEEYFRPNRITLSNFYIFYSAILFFMMLFVGMLFAMLKEKLYLYYIAYVSSFILWVAVLSGNYLSLGFNGWDHGLHATGTFMVFFLILFSAEFLQLKKYLLRINKLFNLSAGVIFLFSILIILGYPYASFLFNVYSSLFFLLLLIIVIYLLNHNSLKNLRYYLIALIIYMTSMGLMTLTFNGLLANTDLTRYAFVFGSYCEIFFFSFILSSRYNEMKNEKLELKTELLNQKINNEKKLEKKIKERTHELLLMNQQLEEAKELLFKESITDKLSGLYNRRYFSEISNTLFDASQRTGDELSVLMLDIDFFKEINDKYGHSVGDDTIIACSEILQGVARSSDVVTRYGGEEFVILLPDTKLDEALKLAYRIKDRIKNNKITINETDFIKITISIGVTQSVQKKDTNIEDIIKRSDVALYKAKKMGRNRVESYL
jgi:diguanylate cyclase (GGDEF)-like protein